MSEKIMTLKELADELGNYCSVNRLRQEICRAEYAKFFINEHPIKFLLTPESRKILYDRLLSSPIIRGRVESGRKCTKIKSNVKIST